MNRMKDVDVLNIESIFKDKYIIPLYQRNFAWGEEQISRLLQDIYESMQSGDEHFYIGSLVVMQRDNGVFEVIDGQQRLTMFSILSSILNMGMHLSLHYDSRPEVEAFFHSLNGGVIPQNRNEGLTSHFFDAIDFVWSTQLDLETADSVTLKSEEVKNEMVKYIKDNVYIVREIMPADTDVAAYFEIMNNRGEQLQEHEIIKGLLLGKLHEENRDDYSPICAKIWDACSQMEVRIQKSFSSQIAKILFGENCDSLKLKGHTNDNDYGEKNLEILNLLKGQSEEIKTLTLEEIVTLETTNQSTEPTADEDDNFNEESIIDFPNFLMHIFRLYYNDQYISSSQKDIPLSEKYLLKVYNAIKQEVKPIDFLLRLLYCRVIFDRYIVKSNITEDDEKRKWLLLKPSIYIYENDKKKVTSLRFENSFKEKQQAIVHAISCLQVSFRSKPYKNFLQTILKVFVNNNVSIGEDDYLKELHIIMNEEFERTSSKYINIKEYNERMQGTNVPHFLFNFTDYLYWWVKSHNDAIEGNFVSNNIKKELELFQEKGFRFLMRNSIEHHYPQKRKEEYCEEGVGDFELNCLGNLMLISKSVNSRLSDKNPIDKAALYSERTDLSPTRQIIYKITRDCGWGKNQIILHLECVEEILNNRKQILGNDLSLLVHSLK